MCASLLLFFVFCFRGRCSFQASVSVARTLFHLSMPCRVVLRPLATAVAAGRERERRRDLQRDAEWALLSNIGAINTADARRHDHGNADGFAGGRFRGGGVNNSSAGGGDGEGGPSTSRGAIEDAKGEEILEGIRLLISVRRRSICGAFGAHVRAVFIF